MNTQNTAGAAGTTKAPTASRARGGSSRRAAKSDTALSSGQPNLANPGGGTTGQVNSGQGPGNSGTAGQGFPGNWSPNIVQRFETLIAEQARLCRALAQAGVPLAIPVHGSNEEITLSMMSAYAVQLNSTVEAIEQSQQSKVLEAA